MSPNSPYFMIAVLVGSIIAVTCGVRILVKTLWHSALGAYSPHPPAPDAIVRRSQSFSVNYINMGLAVHVAVDDHYLHLTPVTLMQWMGTAPVSIPWDDIRLVKPGGKILPATARLANGRTITGPRWCLELAAPLQDDAHPADPATDRAADD